MNVYKSLPKNILWQLTAATDIDAVCIESTPVYIKKAQFSAEKYDRILTEASQYAIYSEETLELSQETKKYTCEPIEITADHIIVNDGRFAGVYGYDSDTECYKPEKMFLSEN